MKKINWQYWVYLFLYSSLILIITINKSNDNWNTLLMIFVVILSYIMIIRFGTVAAVVIILYNVIGMIMIWNSSRFHNTYDNSIMAYQVATVISVVIINRYIGILDKKNEEVRQMSIVDALSGLYNARYFNEQLQEYQRQAGIKALNLTLIIIDIDNFKHINDTYGHDVGDKVIQLVSKAIRQGVRKEEKVFRYGGDEFIVLVEQITRLEAEEIAHRIIDKVTGFGLSKMNPINELVHISMGISSYPTMVDEHKSIFKTADKALYLAKRQLGSDFRFYEEVIEKDNDKDAGVQNNKEH